LNNAAEKHDQLCFLLGNMMLVAAEVAYLGKCTLVLQLLALVVLAGDSAMIVQAHSIRSIEMPRCALG
jgi:hypothetical protein